MKCRINRKIKRVQKSVTSFESTWAAYCAAQICHWVINVMYLLVAKDQTQQSHTHYRRKLSPWFSPLRKGTCIKPRNTNWGWKGLWHLSGLTLCSELAQFPVRCSGIFQVIHFQLTIFCKYSWWSFFFLCDKNVVTVWLYCIGSILAKFRL